MLLVLVGCDGEMNQIVCTEEARSSVTLKILDSGTGEPVSEATITYSVDGGSDTSLECTDVEEFVDNCGSFPLTYEVDGTFEITVSSPGYADKTRTITIEMTADGCHVVGKVLTFNMTP
jgi:hypothetical protein